MKKIYIEPCIQILKVRPVQIIAESFVVGKETDSGNPLDGSDDDNGAWSRDNDNNNRNSVWDNIW